MRFWIALLCIFTWVGTVSVPSVEAKPRKSATSKKISKKSTKKVKAKTKKGKRRVSRPKPKPILLERQEVRLMGYNAFTLYAVKGSGQAQNRAEIISSRLETLLRTVGEGTAPLSIQALAGPGKGAQLLLNGQPLATVTQYELLGNRMAQGSSLAQRWAANLRQVINKPDIQETYFTYAGLPAQVIFRGMSYGMVRQTTPDFGLFTTDGTRQENRIIFWRENEAEPLAAVYLLNRNRRYIVYQRQEN